MYMQVIDHLPNVSYCREAHLKQDKSKEAQLDSINRLPMKLRNHLICVYRERFLTPDSTMNEQDIYERIISTSNIEESLVNEAIIRNSSAAAWWQSLQGLLTAGIVKSALYSFRKLSKRWFPSSSSSSSSSSSK